MLRLNPYQKGGAIAQRSIGYGYVYIGGSRYAAYNNEPQEVADQMTDIAQPLHIPREALIKRLEERVAEEQEKRREAQESARKQRETVLAAVEKLTTDQVANILSYYIGLLGEDLTKWVEEKVEQKKFVSKDVEPSSTETRLDKTIRVLKLASDKEVEIKPTDPVYPLL